MFERRKIDYKEYLLSEVWQHKRELKLNEVGNKCERCGDCKQLQVHHKSYEYLGREPLSDLEVLCKQCHDTEHWVTHDHICLDCGKSFIHDGSKCSEKKFTYCDKCREMA